MSRRITAFTLSVLLWIGGCALPAYGASAQNGADNAGRTTVKAMFLNVGKADAALFIIGDRKYLIDTGTRESTDAMLRALSYFEAYKLDGVIITHTDKDHVGGLKTLLKSDIAVVQLYAPAFCVLDDSEHPVVKLANKYHVPLRRLNAGDEIAVDDTARFITLGPLTEDLEEENNNSLVLKLTTDQGDMLLTGDMLVAEETELLADGTVSNAAVLKVAHHGADDASGEAFIYTVRPQLAVISTDPDAEGNTPDQKVIRRLWDIGADVFITKQASCCVQVTLSGGNAVGKLVNYLVE